MRLLGGDPRLRERGARNSHRPGFTPQTGELNHAPPLPATVFLREDTAHPTLRFRLRQKPPNAANHPPPCPMANDEILRVGGRVHWLVRGRRHVELTRSAHHSRPATRAVTREPNHARPIRRSRLIVRHSARKPLSFVIRFKPPNARHHPRPNSRFMRGNVAGRRVHAVVRWRVCCNPNLSYAISCMINES
jgi:hypothetical protein